MPGGGGFERGHMMGAALGGSAGADNLFPMARGVNGAGMAGVETGAKAFASGTGGAYNVSASGGSASGSSLLGHELSHVVQQRQGTNVSEKSGDFTRP